MYIIHVDILIFYRPEKDLPVLHPRPPLCMFVSTKSYSLEFIVFQTCYIDMQFVTTGVSFSRLNARTRSFQTVISKDIILFLISMDIFLTSADTFLISTDVHAFLRLLIFHSPVQHDHYTHT